MLILFVVGDPVWSRSLEASPGLIMGYEVQNGPPLHLSQQQTAKWVFGGYMHYTFKSRELPTALPLNDLFPP